MPKFKAKDLIIGNDKNYYGVSCKGKVCYVIKRIYDRGWGNNDIRIVCLTDSMDCYDFAVESQFFDKFIPKVE